MSNLFILNETFPNGSNYALLNIISLASILCGILVIISKNPIVSVLFLIGLFINTGSRYYIDLPDNPLDCSQHSLNIVDDNTKREMSSIGHRFRLWS